MSYNPFTYRPECTQLVTRACEMWSDSAHYKGDSQAWIDTLIPRFVPTGYAIVDVETDGLYGDVLVTGVRYQQENRHFTDTSTVDRLFRQFYRQGICITFHNAPYDYVCLRRMGVYLPPSMVRDTLVLSLYDCNTGSKALGQLSGQKLDLYQMCLRQGAPPDVIDPHTVYAWAWYNRRGLLLKYLDKDLEATEEILTRLKVFDNPFTRMTTLYELKLADTTYQGVPTDTEFAADRLGSTLTLQSQVEESIQHILGFVSHDEFKPQGDRGAPTPRCRLTHKKPSSKNKGEYLEARGVSVPRTSRGNYCLDRDTVKSLLGQELPDSCRLLLEQCKDYDKLGRTAAILKECCEPRVYPQFRILDTGRVSTSNPNIQGFPKPSNTPDGQLRRLLLPSPGYHFVIGDESNFQLRIFAAYLEYTYADRNLSDYFTGYDAGTVKEDVHTHMARIYGLITPDMTPGTPEFKAARTISKNCTFGRLFGAEARKITETAYKLNSGRSFDELHQIISGALDAFDKVIPRSELSDRATTEIMRDMNLITYDWLGKRFNWVQAFRKNRLHTSRLVYHIQGIEASIMTLFSVAASVIEWKYGGRLVYPVHDEVIYEFPDATCEEAARQLTRCYSSDIFKLPSGLTPKAKFKPYASWHDAKD